MKKLLFVVEDDLANAETLNLLLQFEGFYEILCFSSGDEILNRLDDLCSLNPALFLLDYNLPGLNGLDLYVRLHATQGLEQAGAILLTATPLDKKEKALIEQQGLHLVSKPYDAEELLDLIRQRTSSRNQ